MIVEEYMEDFVNWFGIIAVALLGVYLYLSVW